MSGFFDGLKNKAKEYVHDGEQQLAGVIGSDLAEKLESKVDGYIDS